MLKISVHTFIFGLLVCTTVGQMRDEWDVTDYSYIFYLSLLDYYHSSIERVLEIQPIREN